MLLDQRQSLINEFLLIYMLRLTIMFFSEPRACVSCTVSCTGVELEKPLISNLRLI